jgi:polygalacturonase
MPVLAACLAAALAAPAFDVRAFGAKGDGQSLDTAAINGAVAAAAAAGGGTVYFPAGTYASFSIRLKSNVVLHLGPGATLLAAAPSEGGAGYDLPEPNEWDLYQDFGHSHWQNSLIYGIGLENVAVMGPGLIDGRGLTRRGPGARWSKKAGDRPLSMARATGGSADPEAARLVAMNGQGNKAIALKLCRNVTLRDLRILNGGHFAVLATGVDDLTIDNVKLDTNRDGLDIDACRNVRLLNVSVNSPNDDAIVFKSSYALGFVRATENVSLTNCQVSGFDVGSVFDGTYKRTQELAPDRDRPTGRIKFGTESNGGFKNVTISNCVFDRSRGLALEAVDGGTVEDVVVSNLVLREVTTAPIFLRVGNRGRGPGEPAVGAIRRVRIDNVTAADAEHRFASILAGLPGHPVEDVSLSHIRLVYRGGGTAEDAARDAPENPDAYPEPSMFGTLPAYGLFLRHARNVALSDVELGFSGDERRPALFLDDVAGARLDGVRARPPLSGPLAVLREVGELVLRDSLGLADGRRERVEHATLPE